MGNYHARCGLGENPYSLILQRITYQYNVKVIPPLVNPENNPFQGGTLSGYDYVLSVDDSHVNRTYGIDTETTKILGTVTISGNLSQGEQINLVNLVMDALIIDIGNGDIILDNTHPSTTVILSAGNHSVNFKNNCTIDTLKIINNKPVHLNVLSNGLTCKNVILNPLNKAKIKLSGDFKDANVIGVNSLNLEAGKNFKTTLPPQVIMKSNSNNEVILGGNFKNIDSLIFKNSCKVIGDNDFLHENLILRIEPEDISSNTFEMLGNLSNASLKISKQSKIKCYGHIAAIDIEKEAKNTNIEVEKSCVINDLKISSPVTINGDTKILEGLLSKINIQNFFDKNEVTEDITENYIKNLINIQNLSVSVVNTPDNKDISEINDKNGMYNTFSSKEDISNKSTTKNVDMTLRFNIGTTTVYKKITVKTKYKVDQIKNQLKAEMIDDTIKEQSSKKTNNIKNKSLISKLFNALKNSFA